MKKRRRNRSDRTKKKDNIHLSPYAYGLLQNMVTRTERQPSVIIAHALNYWPNRCDVEYEKTYDHIQIDLMISANHIRQIRETAKLFSCKQSAVVQGSLFAYASKILKRRMMTFRYGGTK